jgi:hypothetical protein
MILKIGFLLLAAGCLAILIYLLAARHRGWEKTRRARSMESLCIVLSTVSFLAASTLILFMPVGLSMSEASNYGMPGTSMAAPRLLLSTDSSVARLLGIALILIIAPLAAWRSRKRHIVELAGGLLLGILVVLSLPTIGLAYFPAAFFMLAAALSGMSLRPG